jgi:CubicO group peptidase (beta-lactamase class C family)
MKTGITQISERFSNGLKLSRLAGADSFAQLSRMLMILFMSVVLIIYNSAFAQDKTSEIEKIFSWVTPTSPGCVCAVSKDGAEVFNKAFGKADLERDVPLNLNSVFDAGSLRKQFVAAAVLILVEEGKLSLTDDVHKYVPGLPEYGHKITVDHLLTHTSGIRDWQPLLNLAAGDPDALSMILRQRELNFIPGDEWSYSNSGYVLLTEIVNRVSGMAFPEFAKKRFFEPLGMRNSTYVLDMKNVIKNRALAYEKDKDQWKLDLYLGNERGGAGALMTTATDLLIWNDALSRNLLGRFVSTKLQEPAQLNNGRKLYYTRGLNVEPYLGQQMISHSGGAAGYHSWLGRLPDQKVSVAVMCNSDAMGATTIAHRIIELFVTSHPSAAVEDGPPPAIPADILKEVSSKAGLYFNEKTGEPMRLVMQRDRLRIANGPGLLPVGKDSFIRWGAFVEYMSQDKFGIIFNSPDQFALKSMEGKVTIYNRAKSYAPTAAELQSFTGHYRSDELMADFDITAGKAGLAVRVNDKPGPPYIMNAIHPDKFQFAVIMLSFNRDAAGKIVGLDFSNPLLRKVKFVRVGEARRGN